MSEYLSAAREAATHEASADTVTLALLSIAESLAVLAGDLREERLRTESLRGALTEARQEAEDAAELIADVVRIINGDGTDIARIAAIHEAVTQ